MSTATVDSMVTIKSREKMSSIDWTTRPGLPFTFSFEIIDNIDERIKSLGDSYNLWIVCSLAYVFIIFTLQSSMKSRSSYSLRLPLILWNFGLTIFSLATVLRLGPDLLSNLNNKGLFATFCDSSSFHFDPRVKVWIWLFSLSKLVEFGDTFFIVLRKQSLIFLHWFHHAITLLYTMFAIGFYLPAYARWFMTINAAIHTLMYGYYAARAARIRFPKFVNMSITSLQIIQMIAGLAINGTTFYHQMTSSSECDGHPNASIFGLAIYTSFFILFCQFFIRSYMAPKSYTKSKLISDSDNNNLNYSNGTKKLQ
ncbi:elongation of very long chain fatty acids protein 6-like [Panonychus citri]|uniref:elongation of very long chain fatty acids protein 6-like n=1 Tax=Panonychus citri TaxID=50023 RepID=UPI0023075618|nr:elongation of very long chain fatty acids protein 6-like [Panonychus citri]